jgi:hypothetical protein
MFWINHVGVKGDVNDIICCLCFCSHRTFS